MSAALRIDEDLHVHSTFSDGAGTIAENVAAADAAGLARLRCVDHVRADTTWAPEFVAAVRAAAAETELELSCGLEAKILDTGGALDLPADTGGADFVYAADHRVPLADGPADPAAVRLALKAGEADPGALIDAIVEATANAAARHDDVVVAHLFSVLPKIGLREEDVTDAALAELAVALAGAEATVEVSERWRCPSPRALRAISAAGVPMVFSTDSHSPATIGVYDYCTGAVAGLAAEGAR